MEYNTVRGSLEMREYGRNVQRMIEYTVSVDDKEKRNRLAQAIIDLMGQMNPHLRNVEEFKHKLWDHIIIMSDFKLDVDSPYPAPEIEKLRERPQHIGYPKSKIRFKHYGKNVERLVEKARELEDEEKKMAFTESIGNYMKLVYKNWNRENINDQIIINDMKTLSSGDLVLTEENNLDILSRSTRSNIPSSSSPSNSSYKKKRGGKRDKSNYKRRKNQ